MSIRAKRGTRSQVNAAAAANGLAESELLYLVDEQKLAVANGANAFKVVGSMAYRNVTVSTADPTGSAEDGDIWIKIEA